MLKLPLPAVEHNASQLAKPLFVLLKDYSMAGAGHGENFLLVQNCFKVPEMMNTHACTHLKIDERKHLSVCGTSPHY